MKWSKAENGYISGEYGIERQNWSDSRRGKSGISWVAYKGLVRIGSAATFRGAKNIISYEKSILASS